MKKMLQVGIEVMTKKTRVRYVYWMYVNKLSIFGMLFTIMANAIAFAIIQTQKM